MSMQTEPVKVEHDVSEIELQKPVKDKCTNTDPPGSKYFQTYTPKMNNRSIVVNPNAKSTQTESKKKKVKTTGEHSHRPTENRDSNATCVAERNIPNFELMSKFLAENLDEPLARHPMT